MNAKKMIHHEDFRSTEIQIRLKNLVSETQIDCKVKTIGNLPIGDASDNNLIQLIEIQPSGLVLSAPTHTCSKGHALEIEFRIAHLSKYPFDVKLRGQVKEVEKTSDFQDRILISIKNPSDVAWRDFCQLFSKRQEDIHDFFKRVRGY